MKSIDPDVRIQRLTPSGGQWFFGYYDKCPWSKHGDRILVGSTAVKERQPEKDDVLVVGYLDVTGARTFVPVAETHAWNFQQGAMAQWLSLDDHEFVLFNVRSGHRVHARLVTRQGRRFRDLDFPVYAVSPDGQRAASVDFGRLAFVRPGYGYAGTTTARSLETAPDDDGLILMDLRTGESELGITYADLAAEVMPRGEGSSHWIDHIEFSPGGRTLVFLHRWLAADGGPLTRVMFMDLDRRESRCLLDCGAAGHGLWLSDSEYGIWGRTGTMAATTRATTSAKSAPLRLAVRASRTLLPAALKSRIHQESFLVLSEGSATPSTALRQIPHGMRGGHPSLHPDGKWIVSDTLPDSTGHRHLFLASLDGSQLIPLLSLAHDRASANSPYRCDSHPRWDRSGRAVCIDSLHEGFRGLYTVDLSGILAA